MRATRRRRDAGAGREVRAALAVGATAAVVCGLLFNRETVVSNSIGYNLYGATRVLAGEVPYRDFHTLYPPGTVYMNAAVFALTGVALHHALLLVAMFRGLTVLVLYGCARLIMPAGWALAAAANALAWHRPNGPFKAVPMHYGALALALALFAYLRAQTQPRRSQRWLWLTGLAIGLLALCKHNVAAVVFVALAAADVLEWRRVPSQSADGWRPRVLAIAGGTAIPLVAVAAYMHRHGALGPMLSTLIFGPSAFLVARLARVPAPWTFDGAVFYLPLLCVAVGVVAWCRRSSAGGVPPYLLPVVAVAAAALAEAFPRFAREQAIAAMPFAGLVPVYLLSLGTSGRGLASGWSMAALALVVTAIAAGALGVNAETFLDAQGRFRSRTPVAVERARGVYFPPRVARQLQGVVEEIVRRVPPGGSVFAQSSLGSSYLFLADRVSASRAPFWGGVGVSDEERAATLRALDAGAVGLIITSARDLEAERYEPLRAYIGRHFHVVHQTGRVLLLGR